MVSLRVYLVRMALFIVAVAVVVAMLATKLMAAFFANPALNTLILGSAFLGIVYIVRQVTKLAPDFAWLAMLNRDRARAAATAMGDAPGPKPRLLVPIASALGEGKTPLKLSPIAARAVADGITQRLDEEREIARYLIGLLIFLGLLGTFWGLLETIRAVGGVVGNLTVGGDVTEAFASLKAGLEQPLAGMGTSFSSSSTPSLTRRIARSLNEGGGLLSTRRAFSAHSALISLRKRVSVKSTMPTSLAPDATAAAAESTAGSAGARGRGNRGSRQLLSRNNARANVSDAETAVARAAADAATKPLPATSDADAPGDASESDCRCAMTMLACCSARTGEARSRMPMSFSACSSGSITSAPSELSEPRT